MAIKALIKLNISEYAVRLMLICGTTFEFNLVNNQKHFVKHN